MAYLGMEKAGRSPRNIRATVEAVTAEITTLPMSPRRSSPRMIFMAKITPAIGALNVAAIPAAAPHATRFRMRASDKRNHWPKDDPRPHPPGR